MGAVLGLSEVQGRLRQPEGLCDQLRLERPRLLLVEDRRWSGQIRAASVAALLEF